MLHRKVRFPTDASVECQPRCGLPCVLNIEADVFRAFKVSLPVCLSNGVHAPQKKIRETETSLLSIEADGSVRKLRVVLIRNSSNEIAAERDLVIPMNPVDILGELDGRCIPLAAVGCAPT